MTSSINQFQENIDQVKALGSIFATLNKTITPVPDPSDILRSELVMAVSALDFFIHGLVEEKMLLIYRGRREKTTAYENFEISLSRITDAVSNPTDTAWLQDQIQTNLGHKSFQKSDKISSALKLISNKSIWQEVSNFLNKPQSDITTRLDLIIDRRNQIAHQADRNPTYPKIRWKINEKLVTDAVFHIENVCNSIHLVMI